MTRPAARQATPPAAATLPSHVRLALEGAVVAAVAGSVYAGLSAVSPQEPWSMASAWLADARTATLVPHVAGASQFAVSPVVRAAVTAASSSGGDSTRVALTVAACAGALVAGATHVRSRWLGNSLGTSAAAAFAFAASATVLAVATGPNSWVVALACWSTMLAAVSVGGPAVPALPFLGGVVAMWLLLAGDASWVPVVVVACITDVALSSGARRQPWRTPLLLASLVMSVVAFTLLAAASASSPALGPPVSASSLARATLSLAGDGTGAALPGRAIASVTACVKALGLVGTGLVLCSLFWGEAPQAGRRLALLGCVGVLASCAAWASLAPEAAGTVLAVTLAPLVATGLSSLRELPAGRWWQSAMAAWVIVAQALGSYVAPRPSELLVEDVRAVASAVSGAVLLGSDDWRRASVFVNIAARESGHAPAFATMDPVTLRDAARRGTVVTVAGDTRRAELALRGLSFSRTPVWSLPLDEAIAAYGGDRLVAFGLSAASGLELPAAARPPVILKAIGGVTPLPEGDEGMAVVGWRGRTRAAREQRNAGDIAVDVQEGRRIGRSPRSPAHVVARVSSAVSVEVNGHAASDTTAGAALAVLDPMGNLERRVAWSPGEPLRMPVDEGEVGTLTTVAPRPCARAAAGQFESFRLDRPTRSVAVWADQPGAAALILASDTDSAPLVLGADGGVLPLRAEVLDVTGDAGRAGAGEFARARGRSVDALVGTARYLLRLELSVSPTAPTEVVIGLGTTGAGVAAGGTSAAVTACAVGSQGAFAFEGRGRRYEVRLPDPHAAAHGWHPMERQDGRWFRWTAARSADIFVPLARTGDVKVIVDATPATGAADADAVQLLVNGVPVSSPDTYEAAGIRSWLVPAGRWHPGYNVLTLATPEVVVPAERGGGHDTRALGLAVRGITLDLATPTQPSSSAR